MTDRKVNWNSKKVFFGGQGSLIPLRPASNNAPKINNPETKKGKGKIDE
jgi:hypothetical protein